TAGSNFKPPADLSKTLLHSDYFESAIPRATQHCRTGCRGHASTKIFDLQDHLICFCVRSEEHTSELQSRVDLVCRLLLEKKYCAAWTDLDVDAICDWFTDDAVYHNIPIDPVTGREAIKGMIQTFTNGVESIEVLVRNNAT